MGHKDREELQRIISETENFVEVGGVYRHFKGSEYIIRDIIILESSDEPLVVYYNQDDNVAFGRPADEFLEVLTRDGATFNRFQYVRPLDGPPGPASA